MEEKKDDVINEGNLPIEKSDAEETSVDMSVEGETVKVVSKEVDGKTEVARIEFPENRKDDKDWQEKAQKTINVTALKYKQNLDQKKFNADMEQKTKDLEDARKNLLDIGGKKSTDIKFDLNTSVMKELNLTTADELKEVDAADYNRAVSKVSKQYQDDIETVSKNSALTQGTIEQIMNENEPSKVREFVQFAKGLGVSVTPQIYRSWKDMQKSGTKPAPEADFSSLANIQADHIPFVPIGETHEAVGPTERVEKNNFGVMLGNLKDA